MVTLEQFKKYMGHIEAQQAKDDVLSDLLVCEDTTGWISTASELVDDLIELISDNIKGEETSDWISWWLWEIDRDKPEDTINNHVWIKNEKDGLEYKYTILDLEDLYYLITSQEDKIKTKVQEAAPKTSIFDYADPKKGEKSVYEMFTDEIFKDKKEDEKE